MPERVKVFEQNTRKKTSVPVWVWILAAVVLIALVAIFTTRRDRDLRTAPAITPVAAVPLTALPPGSNVAVASAWDAALAA